MYCISPWEYTRRPGIQMLCGHRSQCFYLQRNHQSCVFPYARVTAAAAGRALFKRKWSLDQSPRMPSSSNCAAVDIGAPCKISLWCKPNPAVALNLQTAGAHHSNLGRPRFITWCRGERIRPGESENRWIIDGNLKSKELSCKKHTHLEKTVMVPSPELGKKHISWRFRMNLKT